MPAPRAELREAAATKLADPRRVVASAREQAEAVQSTVHQLMERHGDLKRRTQSLIDDCWRKPTRWRDDTALPSRWIGQPFGRKY
jgi:hypothetical protein